jgi:hypothetical protein
VRRRSFVARSLSCLPIVAVVCGVLISAGAHAQSTPPSFALHDGDRVVFYCDSITAQRYYMRFVEDFIVSR